MTYALIIADPNSDAPSADQIVSTHRTTAAAGKAYQRLDYARWAYVAARQPDGTYPARVAAMEMPAHREAMASLEG